jgi:hypothetical protein
MLTRECAACVADVGTAAEPIDIEDLGAARGARTGGLIQSIVRRRYVGNVCLSFRLG